MTYSIAQAHADGRHASQHPEDRATWIGLGCRACLADTLAAEEARRVAPALRDWTVTTPEGERFTVRGETRAQVREAFMLSGRLATSISLA